MNSEDTYRKFVRYYDSYVKGFGEDLELYRSFCKESDNILEVGCGTGRILEYLLNTGYKVTGVDISEEMVELAREKLSFFLKSGALKLRKRSLADKPLPEQFNKALVTFYTFNYVLEKPEAFLENIYLSMTDSGSIIMDLFYPRTRINPNLENTWTFHALLHENKMIEYKDKRRLIGDTEERIQVFIENGEETKIKTYRKYYSKNTVRRMLENTGFGDIRFSNSYNIGSFKKAEDAEPVSGNFLVRAIKEVDWCRTSPTRGTEKKCLREKKY